MAGADRVGFAVFVKKVGKANFEEDVVIFEVLLEFFFVFDNGVVESDTVRTDNIGVNNEIVFGVGVAHGHGLIPDFFAIRWFDVHASNNGCYQNNYDGYDSENSKCFFHVSPFSLNIFR